MERHNESIKTEGFEMKSKRLQERQKQITTGDKNLRERTKKLKNSKGTRKRKLKVRYL